MNQGSHLRRRTLLLATSASTLPRFAIAQSRRLKIGYVTSLSGPRAAFGVVDEWHLAHIRALLKGGLSVAGGKRLPVDVILKDTQSDPNRSFQVANDLVLRDKVDLILAEDGATAVGQLCDVHGIPNVSTIVPWQPFLFSRNGDVTKGFPFSFNFFWGADDLLRIFASMWRGVATNKQVGTLYIDSPAGRAFADPQRGMPRVLQESGFKETGAGFFKMTTDDFSNQIATFKTAGAQILSGFMFEGHFATLWKQAQQLGYRPEVVTMAAAFLFPSAMKALGPAGNGMSTEVWWTPDYPYKSSLTGQTAGQLASAWETATGQQWTQPLGYAHALWEVGLGALKASADPLDRTAVRDAIRDTTLETIVGTVDFKKSPIKSVAVTSLAGGQWRRTAEGARFPYELRVVNNALAKHVRVVDELTPLSKLK